MTEATFDNGVVRLYQGDARQVLREMPAESVHCVVTSPPYWGLRDYGLEPLVWGGDDHAHEWDSEVVATEVGKGNWAQGVNGRGEEQPGGVEAKREPIRAVAERGFCPCGAWHGSLGLEPTIDLYVQHVIQIFREVRRLLRKDGTLWLNMGDSYAGSGKGQMANGEHHQEPGTKQGTSAGTLVGGLPTDYAGLKPKDLCMMPARVALALQADGWWLRSDIVWSKPNPMPESVQDRPTRSHEYLFLLTKAERYFYDADAIREEGEGYGRSANFRGTGYENNASYDNSRKRKGDTGGGRNSYDGSGRNRRSVWEIATEPYPEAHFATFPQKLVEPCILAGTSQRGVCPECGSPWERVVEATGGTIGQSWHNHENDAVRGHRGGDDGHNRAADLYGSYKREITGWSPTCDCGSEGTVPATVLDPFAGSGTVAYVAQRLGRRAIGIDLSAEYLALAEKRMRGQTLPMELAP